MCCGEWADDMDLLYAQLIVDIHVPMKSLDVDVKLKILR